MDQFKNHMEEKAGVPGQERLSTQFVPFPSRGSAPIPEEANGAKRIKLDMEHDNEPDNNQEHKLDTAASNMENDSSRPQSQQHVSDDRIDVPKNSIYSHDPTPRPLITTQSTQPVEPSPEILLLQKRLAWLNSYNTQKAEQLLIQDAEIKLLETEIQKAKKLKDLQDIYTDDLRERFMNVEQLAESRLKELNDAKSELANLDAKVEVLEDEKKKSQYHLLTRLERVKATNRRLRKQKRVAGGEAQGSEK